MDFWLRLSHLIDTLNRRVGVSAGWLILAMTIVSALNAVTRKFLNLSSRTFSEMKEANRKKFPQPCREVFEKVFMPGNA